MDAARKLNVSLLTVSPVSHNVSQNGVLSLLPARNQFLFRLWFVGRCMPDCCVTLFVDETSKPSELCIVCCRVSYYCYRSCSFSAIDHGPSHAHALNRYFEHRRERRACHAHALNRHLEHSANNARATPML